MLAGKQEGGGIEGNQKRLGRAIVAGWLTLFRERGGGLQKLDN